MKRFLAVLAFLLTLAFNAGTAQAMTDTGEAYVEPTFEELTQTSLVLGGIDINKPEVAEEYLKMMYCNTYRQIYKDDFMVHKITQQIALKFNTKKEYPRTLFQVVGKLTLGKYDFTNMEFPFLNKDDYTNVGSVSLLVWTDVKPYCISKTGEWGRKNVFPTSINVVLSQPLNIVSLKASEGEARKILDMMERMGNSKRDVYVRFRVRVQALYTGPRSSADRVDFGGNMVSVDLFYDKELTMWLTSLPL